MPAADASPARLAPLSVPQHLPGLVGFATAASLAGGVQRAPGLHPTFLWLAAVRLPHVSTDLLVSMHVPLEGAEATGGAAAGVEQAPPGLLDLLASLQIHDWGLFGAGEGGT